MDNALLAQLIGISGYIIYITTSAGVYGIFALGLNLQWGFTGLINFGVVGFMTFVSSFLLRSAVSGSC